MWVVMMLPSERVFGGFDSEQAAIKYARSQSWSRSYMVRFVETIAEPH